MDILERFKMKDCNSILTPTELGLKLTKNGTRKKVDVTLYKQIVGSHVFDINKARYYSCCHFNQQIHGELTEIHLLTAKRIFRYLKDTANLGILYKNGGESMLIGFSNSDYAGDIDDRKSASGFVFMLNYGAAHGPLKNNR